MLAQLVERVMKNFVLFYGVFELTYRCNLHCRHCYVVRDIEDELTTEEVKSALDQLAEVGCLYLTFTGGEPLVREDFFELATYARRRGFEVSLLTNVTLVTPEVAHRLYDLAIVDVDVSLYGAEPRTHDWVTQVPGSFERTQAAIEYLVQEGISVQVKVPIMKVNVDQIGRIRDLVQEMGAEFICDPFLTPRNDRSPEPLQFRLSDEELYSVLGYYMPPGSLDPEGGWDLICTAGRISGSISPRGDVYPCVALPLRAGNIREKPLAEIWRSSPLLLRLRSIRREDLRECHRCPLIPFCSRCMGLAYLEEGDFLAPAREACRVARQLYRKGVSVHGKKAL